MPDQTMTSRDVIRAAIADWMRSGYPSREAFERWGADVLAEQLDGALFGQLCDDGKRDLILARSSHFETLLDKAAALAALQAEVRRLMVLGKYAGRPVVRMRVAVVDPSDAPHIAALLREEAARV